MKKTRVEANGEGRDALFAGASGAEASYLQGVCGNVECQSVALGRNGHGGWVVA